MEELNPVVQELARRWVAGGAGNPYTWAPPCDPSTIPDALAVGDVLIQDQGDRLVKVEIEKLAGV